ncbi:hypothetical protein FJ414_13815 [Mesorhizobium sp. B3-1-6]|uniref:hypothetical protein n=1 Tax=Mesorhizobium sp. B3-1-6 TaxID=2589895 RepID=UPI00112C115D|nr:hypothetical protein [Mesorhizobium sp. B3-1-6]TPI37425.1 hypothetical protein FJ414_13815 [Mesorhizobium sp. B3-1-6]
MAATTCAKSNWLANRTFIAEDGQGRIIVGSTKEAFFSLDRPATSLLKAGLDINTALNLDGGPIVGLSGAPGQLQAETLRVVGGPGVGRQGFPAAGAKEHALGHACRARRGAQIEHLRRVSAAALP